MAKKIDFKAIEKKWQAKWGEDLYLTKDFAADKEKEYVLVEFPYPSASGLHVGHAFTMTGADAYARKKRMDGENVLFPMGWDAFGLPTENYAIKTGIHPATVTKNSTDNFRRQMKKMAFSFDWDRQINTTDPDYYRWTQWIFIQLFKHGLAHKEEMPINWCPSCKIGLANEEVLNKKSEIRNPKSEKIQEKTINVCERCGAEVSRRNISQWIVKITDYAERLLSGLEKTDFVEKVKTAQINWIGKSTGAKVKFKVKSEKCKVKELEVFTTRPDTIWGATFMVVAPEHEIVREITNYKSQSASRRTNSKIEEIKKYVESARKKSELERSELQKDKTGVFSGLYAINPVSQKEIPIWISDFVLSSYGTGAIMAVPAHDHRDFAFAKKFGLPVVPVIKPERGDWDFEKEPYVEVDKGKSFNSPGWDDMKPAEAIKKALKQIEKDGLGQTAVNYHLRDWIFSRQHYWGEPIPMVFCPDCAEKGITWRETEEGENFLANSKLEVRNSKQIENSNDQNLKQKSFGNSDFGFRNSRPPVGGLAGWFPVPEEELPVKLPDVEKYQPTDTGESPLATIKDFVETTCPICGGPARRETDTMPNWAGSDWYFLAYCLASRLKNPKSEFRNPKRIQDSNDQNLKQKSLENLNLENSKLFRAPSLEFRAFQDIFTASKDVLRYWLPVDIYIGGDEHNTLHLLYSRFIYQFLWDIGVLPQEFPEPYSRRVSHGVILGSDNQRMSKSRGNVINPDEVWEKYGVDALRTYLLFMGPFEGTMSWNEKALQGVVRFLNKFYSFIEAQSLKCKVKSGNSKSKVAEEKNKKNLINKLIDKVSKDLDKLQFNTAIAAMMETLNKFTVHDLQFTKEELGVLVQLVAPFAPYTAEELWEKLGGEGSVHMSNWPKAEEKYLTEDEVLIPVQTNGKLRGVVKVAVIDAENESKVAQIAREDSKINSFLTGKRIIKTIYAKGKLINFVIE